MGVLAEKLNLNYEDTERWILNLIRTSKLDAKIDTQKWNPIIPMCKYKNIFQDTMPIFFKYVDIILSRIYCYEQLIDHKKGLLGHTYKFVSQLLEHAQAQAAR